MADVNISKFRASVNRPGSAPAAPGFAVSEGQNPVEPSGTSQDHLPVTIAPVSTGLAITEAQVLSGAGTVGQYIRGDGSLADFPASTGGGSSVSYYLNGSVSQGTIGGVAYRELNKAPVFGAGTDITINADGYIASFITDANDPNLLEIPGGNWNLETYFSASSNGGTPSFYVELYKYNGTTFTLIASSVSAPEFIAFGTNLNPYFSTLAVPTTVLLATDRLAVRYFVNHSGRTITLHTENNHLCQVITTFTTGLTALNGLTDQVQFFQVGTAGTNFNISSVSPTHTFNLPSASASNRGALTSADWSTFNSKENAITAGTTAQYFRGDKTFQTLNTAVVPELTNLYYTEARVNANTNVAANTAARHNAVTLGTANGLSLSTQVLSLGLASAGVTGALSGTDWSTFNSKQNALTNPVTGTGTSGQVAYFTGTSEISSESNLFWDATNDRLGINTSNPLSSLQVGNGNQTAINEAGNKIHIATNNTRSALVTLANSSGGATVEGIFESSAESADLRVIIGATSNHAVILRSNNTEAMRIFTSRNIHIGSTPSSDNGGKLQVNGSAIISDGTQGLIIRAYTGVDGWGAIYPVGVTPNTTNYTLIAKSTNAVLNASTSVTLAVGDSGKLTANSTGISVTGTALVSSSLRSNSHIIVSDGSSSVVLQGYINNALRIAASGSSSSGGARGDLYGGLADFSSSVTAQVNNISADGAGVVLQGYVDNNLRIAVRGSGYNSGSRGGLLASTGDFSSSVTSGFFGFNALASYGFTSYAGSSASGLNINFSTNYFGGFDAIYQSSGNTNDFGIWTNGGNNNQAKFYVKNNGNILVGTPTDSGQKMQVYSSGTTRIRIDAGGNNTGVLLAESGTSQWSLASAGTTLLFYNELTGATRFSLTSNGLATFNSLGTGTVTATAGLLSTVSDSSYKLEDGFIDCAIEKVLSLKPRYFYWNQKSGLPTDIRQLGFYAQEVNEALGEEAANTPQNENTPWGISDRSIIAMLTKAIQELKQEIDTLKN